MWNPFKKKNSKNRVDELVGKLMLQNRVDELETQLQAMNISELNLDELETYYHFRGMYAFKHGLHDEAVKHFKEGLRYHADSQLLMFSLGQEYIYLHQPQQAFELFDRCNFPDLNREYILAMSRYAYLYNEYERGIDYANQFSSYYLELKMLDDNFVYIRGLPFFGYYINHLLVHCMLGDKLEILKNKISEYEKKCAGYHFDWIRGLLDSCQSQQYGENIVLIEEAIKEASALNLPTEFNRLRAACLKAISSNAYEVANEILDEISLHLSQSFHRSIVILAKAAVANKFGQDANERIYRSEFMMEQPLLLEPGTALECGLLAYQEKLKQLFYL